MLTALVVLHHIATAYSGLGLWYVNEAPHGMAASIGLQVFLLVDQSWFMGAFFLLSGYFTPKSYDRKGPRAFLRDRLIRLGIPLLVFYFVVSPLLFLGSYHGGSLLGFYAGSINSGPLWFVFVLLVFDCGYVAFRELRKRSTVIRPLDYRKVIGFALALGVLTYLVRMVIPIGLAIPVIDLPTSAYLPQYISFFVLGTVAYRQDWLSTITARMGKIGLGMAIGGSAVFLPLALTGGASFNGYGTLASLCYALWDSTFAVGVILALLALFRHRFNTQGPLGRRLSGNAFTVYVIHAILVTAAVYLLSGLALPTLAKFAIAAVIVIPACFSLAGPVRRIPGLRKVL